MRTLILGCGYLGSCIARNLIAAGHEVHTVRRSPEDGPSSTPPGAVSWIADVCNPRSLETLPHQLDSVINVVSSSRGGLDSYREVYLEGTRNVLQWLEARPLRAYLLASSSSVYAQTDGTEVTEDSPAEGASPTSQVLVEVESELLRAHQRGFPAVIARLTGLYGRGRGHLFHQFIRGEARLHGAGERWLNMLHVDDAAAAFQQLLDSGRPGRIYNVTDNSPVQEREFLAWLAAQLHLPMPLSIDPAQRTERKRGDTNKRVSNRRIREETGWRPAFPSYREGYADAIAQTFTRPPAS